MILPNTAPHKVEPISNGSVSQFNALKKMPPYNLFSIIILKFVLFNISSLSVLIVF